MVPAHVREQVRGCLLGVCIGDALGMPVEKWEYDKVRALEGGKGILGFIKPPEKVAWHTVDLAAGQTTDDTQLTVVVARSLIRTGGLFNQADCAQEHVRALDSTDFGWGGTTRDSITAIKRGERDLNQLPAGKGCGNGVIMKIAPVALANFLMDGSQEDLWRDCYQLGVITHPDYRATIGAYAVALALRHVLTFNVESARQGKKLLGEIIREVDRKEVQLGVLTDRVSAKLRQTYRSFHNHDLLRETVGCKFHSLETVGFTLGMFLNDPWDFKRNLIKTVNSGGDTDSNASIVGALIGAHAGREVIPQEWIDFNPAFKEAIRLADDLCALAK